MKDREVVDALGQSLSVGDDVAYVHRLGSQTCIERRTIGEIGWRMKAQITKLPEWQLKDEEPFIKFEGSTRVAMPYNTVKVPKENQD